MSAWKAGGATRPPQRIHTALLVCVLALILGEWAVIVGYATQLTPPHVSDFGMYYAAAMLLRHNPHGDIYSASALLNATRAYGGCPHLIPPQYVYPPLLAIALEPLTFFTCGQALVIWTALNALLWLLAAAMIVHLLRPVWPSNHLATWTLVITGVIAFWPAYTGLFLGQSHLLMLFLMLAGIWLEEKGHSWLAGVTLVCAALVKPLPALLLVYYLMRGRWRLIGGALIGGAVCLLVMLAGSGLATVVASATAALRSTQNQAHPGQDVALSIVAGPVGAAVAVLAASVYLVTLVTRRRANPLLGAGWTLCSMLLFSPVVWSFYLVWLLPALAICLGAIHRAPGRRATLYAVNAAVYLALATPFLQMAIPFATLALWVLCGALYWLSGETVEAPAPAAAAVT